MTVLSPMTHHLLPRLVSQPFERPLGIRRIPAAVTLRVDPLRSERWKRRSRTRHLGPRSVSTFAALHRMRYNLR